MKLFQLSKRIIQKIEVYSHPHLRRFRNIHGHLSEYEGLTLYRCAKGLKPNSNIVEVGSFRGRSANYVCAGIDKPGTKLYCIDIWVKTNTPGSTDDDQIVFVKNTKEFSNLVIAFKGTSRGFASWFSGKIDLVFIDADHSYEGCKEDIVQLLPLTKRNAFVLFHDYGNPCGVKDAVDEFVRKRKLAKVDLKHSICVCKKIL